METTISLLEDMDRRREELFALAEELIAAPSQNPPGIVTDAAAVAQRYLNSMCDSLRNIHPSAGT